MSASSAFNDEKGGSSSVGEAEYAYDPVSGKIFSSDYNRPAWLFGGKLVRLDVKCLLEDTRPQLWLFSTTPAGQRQKKPLSVWR